MKNTAAEGNDSVKRRNTKQKNEIIDTLVALGSHVSAGEVYGAISKKNPALGRATVFRVLSDMADDGALLRVKTPSGDVRYDITTKPHYHVICRKCGRVADVGLDCEPSLLTHLTDTAGFAVDEEFIEFIGVCPACLSENNETKPSEK